MTAQDILAFASSHGVLVHPRINRGFGSLDAFVSEYNGMCPSVPNRQCPCQEALDSIAARDPMDQHCDGYLIATAAYMNAVDPKGKLYGEVDDQPPVSDEVSEVVKGYLVGIDEAIKLFDSEKHEESFDTLVELADGTDCNVCKEQFMTEAIHVNNARNLCELPYVAGCNEEKARVKARLDKMRSFFAGAVDSQPSDSPKKSAPSPYRAAMADWMKSADLEPYPQKVRFFMASQLAGGKCSTIEEAKDAAMAAHAEWFA